MYYGTAPRRSIAHSLNLVWVLMWHNFTPRNDRETMKLFWVVVEPAAALGTLILVFSLIGRTAAYGRSFPVFLLTGILVLSLFTQTVGMVSSAVGQLQSARRLPAVGPFHEALARVGFKLIAALLYTAILAIGIEIYTGYPVRPDNIWPMVGAYGIVIGFGMGWGLILGYCGRFLTLVDKIYRIVSRSLLFISGIFYVPSFMPPVLRDWLAWNPLLHAVELMRIGYYPRYPETVFSLSYLLGVAGGCLLFGVALVWRKRARLYE